MDENSEESLEALEISWGDHEDMTVSEDVEDNAVHQENLQHSEVSQTNHEDKETPDSSWAKATEQDYPTPIIRMPNLQAGFRHLLQYVRAKSDDELHQWNFPTGVKTMDFNQMLQDANAMIEPEVLDLQGHLISPER